MNMAKPGNAKTLLLQKPGTIRPDMTTFVPGLLPPTDHLHHNMTALTSLGIAFLLSLSSRPLHLCGSI